MSKTAVRILLILGVLLIGMIPLAIFLVPDEKAESMSQVVESAMDAGVAAIDLSMSQAEEVKFTPCLIATGAKAGLQIGLSNIDAITAEATEPDGKLALNGGPISYSACMSASDVPSPWPPTEPDPKIIAAVESGVPLTLNVAKALIEPKVPEEGGECVRGEVALALLDSLSPLVTESILDAVKGEAVTTLPAFEVNYSGCGVVEEPEATEEAEAAPEPEEATDADAEETPASEVEATE